MKLQNVYVSARYEFKLITRSFVFWVLFLFSVVGITVLQWLVQGKAIRIDWLMHEQVFSFPLVNAYLYNIVQAFILIFVTTDLFNRERRWGAREALHARPVSNSEYFTGKATGIVSVFLLLGIFSLLVCCGINILGSTSPFSPWYYLYYFFTLTIPSLLFFTGFSLWLTWIVRSRILSLMLLLFFLYFTVTLLPDVYHGIFDFTGSALSSLFSVMTGHVDGMNYLLHRLAYVLAGIGFICWTIRLQERLPNDKRAWNRFGYAGCALLLIGILLGGLYASNFIQEERIREEYRAAFLRFAGKKPCRVLTHDITFRQRGSRVESASELTLHNPNEEPVPHLVLYLNPELKVESLEEGRESLSFTRDGPVLAINRSLAPGDSVRLSIRYSGELDGRICYLDVNDASYYDTRRGNNFFHLGRRHVLVSDVSVVLVPEVMWYPMAIPPVNLLSPALTGKDYTLYRLRVIAPVQPVVLSQGEEIRRGDTLEFLPPRPLEGLSLCAGHYEHQTLNLQGVLLDWYYFKKNDFITPLMKPFDKKRILNMASAEIILSASGRYPNLSDSQRENRIADIVLRRDWYSGVGSRLLLVETPLPFVSHARAWKGRSEYIQPGMILLGERGMGMNIYRDNTSKIQKILSEDAPLRAGLRAVTGPFVYPFTKNIIQNPFLNRLFFHGTYTGEVNTLNPYYFLYQFSEPTVTITSSRYGGLDRVLKDFVVTKHGMNMRKITSLERSDIEVAIYLQDHTLEEALRDRNLSPYVLQKIIDREAGALLDRVEILLPLNRFYEFLKTFYTTHYGEVPLDTLCARIKSTLDFDFEQVLREWSGKERTSFLLRDIKFEQIEGEWLEYIARFKVKNTGNRPGFIIYGNDVGGEYDHLVLQPGECKQVSTRISTNSFFLDLGISRNIPSNIHMHDDFSGSIKETRDTTQGIWDISPSVFEPVAGEIIVDNEDPGFRLIIPEKKWLQNYFFKEQPYSEGFGGLVPKLERWNKIFSSKAYGNVVKNFYAKTEGRGTFKAEWSAEIQEDGTYEILVMVPYETTSRPNAQHYTVHGEGREAEEILLSLEKEEWLSLGKFELKRGKSSVVLDDRVPVNNISVDDEYTKYLMSDKKHITADAVKWVKVK